jgi:hypothetical protein
VRKMKSSGLYLLCEKDEEQWIIFIVWERWRGVGSLLLFVGFYLFVLYVLVVLIPTSYDFYCNDLGYSLCKLLHYVPCGQYYTSKYILPVLLFFFLFWCKESTPMKHRYSILERVLGMYRYPILLWYSLGTHRRRTYFIFIFLQRVHVWYSCGTRVVHKFKKTQFFFLFLLFSFFIYKKNYVF